MVDYVVLPANHWLWYVAQICLGGSFIAPSMIALRGMLATGFLFLFTWSIHKLHVSVDSAVFAGTYMIINLIQLGRILWGRRHITFDQDREAVYLHYFGPKTAGAKKWNCSRVTFNELTKDAKIKSMRRGEAFALRGDRCETLSILLSGQISYQQHHASPDNNNERVKMHGSEILGVIDAVEFIHRETVRGAVWGIDAVADSDDVKVLVIAYTTIDRVSTQEMGIGDVLTAICGIQVSNMLFGAETEHIHRLLNNATAEREKSPISPQTQQQIMPFVDSGAQQRHVVNVGEKPSTTELVSYHISE